LFVPVSSHCRDLVLTVVCSLKDREVSSAN
jgi:hypothetical protein